MTNTNLAAPCGLYCDDCEHRPEKCGGCADVKGRPFWTAQYGVPVCPLYGCAVEHKGLAHCGLCSDFPCLLFNSMRDPSLSDAEAEASLLKRQQALLQRKENGTDGR